MDGHPRPGDLPPEAGIVSWIETVVSRGIRRPGYPADEWVEGWAAERFREFGLDAVHLEPVSLRVWEDRGAELVVWDERDPATRHRFAAFPLPYTLPTAGCEASVVEVAGGGDLRGAVALDRVSLASVPQGVMVGLATTAYDPEGELDGREQVLPFGSRMTAVAEPAVQAGAAGYVGVLDFPWTTRDYYVPYDAVERPIPAVYVDAEAGRAIEAMRGGGRLHARIAVDAACRHGTSHNVIGTLPGASDEWVVVGSHHDAPWASAVEDGSGIALVLAQARYWSRMPREARPHNMLFLLNAGHMAGGAGIHAFIADHAELLDKVVASVHLEHAAAECVAAGGVLVPTGAPEVRWWFTSRDPALERAVIAAIETEGLTRSLVLRPDVFMAHPPTDGGPLHLAGVPLVDFLTAPMYLFDSADTLDKVHRPSLTGVSRAAVRIIASLAGRDAASLRAGALRAVTG